MTTQILRPNAAASVSSTAWLGNGGTYANLADDNDSTYLVENYGTETAGLDVSFTDLAALPAGAIITSVTVRIRAKITGNPPGFLFAQKQGATRGATDYVTLTGSFVTYTGSARTLDPDGNPWTVARVNSLQVRFWKEISSQYPEFVSEVYLDVVYNTYPTATVTGPTEGSTVVTRTPTVTWTVADPDGDAQANYQVKVFTQAQYSAAGFDPEISTPVYNSGGLSGTNLSHVTGSLPNGLVRAYVKSGQAGGLYGPWDYNQFTVNVAEPTPTAVTPATGSTVTTDVPTLGATITASPGGDLQKIEWQIASNTGFTTNVKTVLSSTFLASGAVTAVVPDVSQLFQGTWYVRARSVDEAGVYSAYTAYNSFIVSHPPSTTGHAPTGGQSVDYAGTGSTVFSWVFTDPSPVDSQTAFQVVVERVADGSTVLDSGKITSTVQQWTGVVPSARKDDPLRWKVRVYDSDDVVSVYSANQLFTSRDAPTVAITSPTAGGTANNPSPTVTWTFTATAGRTQASFRAVYKKAGVTVHDSGIVLGTALTYTPPSSIYANGDSATVDLTVTDSVGLSKTDTKAFTIAYTPPTTPVLSVDISTFDSDGKVLLSWSGSTVDANFDSWKVYRREGTTGAWTLISQIFSQATTQYQDYTAKSNQQYQYAVSQIANKFGALVESAMSTATVTPTSENYWLLYPADPTKNVLLPQVTADDFDEEYEEATLNLIGRGRKKDYGTRFGFSGTLTAEFWDDSTTTARQKKQQLEALKALKQECYLRNPFGDIWMVAVGTISVSRIAGVGQREYVTVTIPYQEVI